MTPDVSGRIDRALASLASVAPPRATRRARRRIVEAIVNYDLLPEVEFRREGTRSITRKLLALAAVVALFVTLGSAGVTLRVQAPAGIAQHIERVEATLLLFD